MSVIRMIAKTVELNLALFIPVAVALVTAVLGPVWLARQNESAEERKARMEYGGELSVRIIDEGRDMRKELRERVDNLETRLVKASQDFQDALEEIRKLKTENDKLMDMIADLKEKISQYEAASNTRISALESPSSSDDKSTQIIKDGGTSGEIK